jgi:hypothetical protein
MSDKTGEKQPDHLFKPGQSGNPKGRPAGARNKLGEDFIQALQESFQAHGADTIETVRVEKPDQYLKVIASILPKDLNVNINQMDGYTDDELIQRIRTLDATIRPFLDAQGTDGLGGGASAQTAH